MINKKTIAGKQDDRALIIRGTSDMDPSELARLRLAMEQILTSRNLEGVLNQLGRVHEVPFSDGRKTLSVILTYEGIKRLGIDLNTVFKGCGGREDFNVEKDVRNGVLVNLDLYQQVTILRAIVEKKPKLASVLGLYNLKGSRKVYEKLIIEGVPRQLGIWWIWTGDRYVPRQEEASYPEEGIVSLSKLPTLQDNRFVLRRLGDGGWGDNAPGDRANDGAVVFGAQE